MLFADLLKTANDLLGAPPRRIGWWSRRELRLRRPGWIRSDRRFATIFRDQDRLLEHGHVVWGHIVQANMLLFKPGPDDCPAAIIYSLDARAACAPKPILQEAAHALFSIKGQKVEDPSLQIFADKLADEHVVDLKLSVPGQLTGNVPCFYTCILVRRDHMPGECLLDSLFPLLVAPELTEATMMLPGRFWPRELVKRWERR